MAEQACRLAETHLLRFVAAPPPPSQKLTNKEVSKAHKTHTYTLTCVYVYYVNYKTTYTYTSVYYTLVDSHESYRFSQYITLYTQHQRYLNIEYSHTKPTHAPQDRHYLSSSEYPGSPLSEMPSRPAPASVSPFVRHAALGFALAEHAIRLALRDRDEKGKARPRRLDMAAKDS